MGTRSRQTSIHDPSPQPVSQERGAGEPVGLHHGPSLRRRRGGGKKKNKNPAMELSPPPLGISEAAAAPPAVRSLQLQFPARMLRPAPLPPGAKMRRAPRGPGPPAAREALTSGAGEMPNRFPTLAAAPKCKKGPSSPWESGRPQQNGAFLDPSCSGEMAGAGFGLGRPGAGCWSHGRAAPAGGGEEGGGKLGRALRPAPAHSPSHPHARTRSCCRRCCCCCRRRLEAAGALKARLLPTASAAPGLFPSSAGGRGRGCGCSLLQWGARSREPAPGQQAASRQVPGKTREALWQAPSNRATRLRAAFTQAPRVPSSLPCSGHLRFRTAKRSGSPGVGRKTTLGPFRSPLGEVCGPLIKFNGEAWGLKPQRGVNGKKGCHSLIEASWARNRTGSRTFLRPPMTSPFQTESTSPSYSRRLCLRRQRETRGLSYEARPQSVRKSPPSLALCTSFWTK